MSIKPKFLNQKGDTIVEVLLAVGVLGLVLTISYGLANRNTQYDITSRERVEALKYSEEQVEMLRQHLNDVEI